MAKTKRSLPTPNKGLSLKDLEINRKNKGLEEAETINKTNLNPVQTIVIEKSDENMGEGLPENSKGLRENKAEVKAETTNEVNSIVSESINTEKTDENKGKGLPGNVEGLREKKLDELLSTESEFKGSKVQNIPMFEKNVTRLKHLKSISGSPMSNILNVIFEEFFNEHNDEIIRKVKKNINGDL